ncbi:MAG: hypothetical protein A2Y62_08410 [Candidatus Fischerbacteria bacterium RBG_13_37_8]|uniref:Fibronectin type-III domain-containing protein n=1 Tax=Candidatus Fischerbacteria bacterium RBG_13_37_8 TaxID=1817863 RepID=A0A1F5VMQ2_9BACT|nr:MAG: hypothetical protein A2Y62_08410 [Candidatus Fischerbacteria bacterium RBG_13_37_8]
MLALWVCEAYISGGALWDVAYNIAQARGDAGWTITERLWFESLSSIGSAFQITAGGQCNPDASIDGCAASNWYTVMIGVDDDNGNPTDGTPNGSRIWNAFDGHGIACGANSGNHDICQQPEKPVLSVAGSDEQLAFSWTPVDHATGYRIFVNVNGAAINCNAEGWIPVVDTDNVNYYKETEVPNAFSYGFAVQAINGNDTCVSDLSDCVFGGPAANSKVNLTGKKSLGWDNVLVPSDNPCDSNQCTRSASLSANGSSSKINFKVINDPRRKQRGI